MHYLACCVFDGKFVSFNILLIYLVCVLDVLICCCFFSASAWLAERKRRCQMEFELKTLGKISYTIRGKAIVSNQLFIELFLHRFHLRVLTQCVGGKFLLYTCYKIHTIRTFRFCFLAR